MALTTRNGVNAPVRTVRDPFSMARELPSWDPFFGGRPATAFATAFEVKETYEAFVMKADLSLLYARIAAVEGSVGRDATDPRILLALWLLATIKGVGSARELNRLCERHQAYQWICGEVTVNHDLLSRFRSENRAFLDGLLTQQVAALMQAGMTVERVAQDGARTRASAGKASFERRETLEESLREAEQLVQKLAAELDEDPAAASRREKAAKKRAADERLERVQAALVACAEVEAIKQKRGGSSLKTPARGSTTDPDARNMKMANGGFNPAYNVQFATDTQHQVIVGVDVVKEGSDAGLIVPMVEQIEQRTGVRPKELLVDGGYSSHEEIEALNDPEQGYKVYMPVKAAANQLARGEDPYAARDDESARQTEWRTRMGTEAAKTIYKQRASTAECVNALARQRGLTQFRVRGLEKVRTAALWFAVAHNTCRWAVLCAKVETTIKHA